MNRLVILVVLFTLIGCKAFVPKKYKFVISDERWNTIKLEPKNTDPILTDSMVVMYSNRNFHPERKKILGDYIDSAGFARVFLASAKNGICHLYAMNSVSEAVLAIGKKRNLVFYVEGMGKNFPIGLERAFSLSIQHGLTVVMMDYPSINIEYSAFKNFNYARKSSFRTAPYLIDLLKEFQSEKQKGRDWTKVNTTLFHHSMGNIMLKRILEERMDTVLVPNLVDQLVLNAPCVNVEGHKVWLEKSLLAKKTFVHYNKDDTQLNGAKILAGKTQLGAKLYPPLAQKAQYVDFNPVVGPNHSNFIDIPLRAPIKIESRNYYFKLFNGVPIDFGDTTLFGLGWKGMGVSLRKY